MRKDIKTNLFIKEKQSEYVACLHFAAAGSSLTSTIAPIAFIVNEPPVSIFLVHLESKELRMEYFVLSTNIVGVHSISFIV